MHPVTGDIKTFDSQAEAEAAGYTIPLSVADCTDLAAMTPEERKVWLRGKTVIRKGTVRPHNTPHPSGLNRKQRREREQQRLSKE
jgi:hypothetical protein